MRGSAMFTTVESSDAIAEPRIVAKRVQRPGADFIRSGTNASLTMAVPNLMSIASFEDAQSQPFGGQAGAENKTRPPNGPLCSRLCRDSVLSDRSRSIPHLLHSEPIPLGIESTTFNSRVDRSISQGSARAQAKLSCGMSQGTDRSLDFIRASL